MVTPTVLKLSMFLPLHHPCCRYWHAETGRGAALSLQLRALTALWSAGCVPTLPCGSLLGKFAEDSVLGRSVSLAPHWKNFEPGPSVIKSFLTVGLRHSPPSPASGWRQASHTAVVCILLWVAARHVGDTLEALRSTCHRIPHVWNCV